MQEIKQANRRHDPPVLKHTVHWAVTTNSTCMTIARYMLHRKSVHWIFGFREMWKLRSGGWFRTCQGKRGGGFQTEGTEFVEAWKQEKTWRRFYKYVYMGGGISLINVNILTCCSWSSIRDSVTKPGGLHEACRLWAASQYTRFLPNYPLVGETRRRNKSLRA